MKSKRCLIFYKNRIEKIEHEFFDNFKIFFCENIADITNIYMEKEYEIASFIIKDNEDKQELIVNLKKIRKLLNDKYKPFVILTEKIPDITEYDLDFVDFVYDKMETNELIISIKNLLMLYNAKLQAKKFNFEIIRLNDMYKKMEEELKSCKIELEDVLKENENLIVVDRITGLYNKDFLKEKILKEAKRVARNNKTFSLVLADIDYFRKINEKHGQDCGDEILKIISESFCSELRKCDFAGRWISEQILIVLPETKLNGALDLSQRLKSKIGENKIKYKKEYLDTTVSFGVAEYVINESIEETIKRADFALYKGKAKGINNITSFSKT